MKTKIEKQTITKKYLEFENFEDFKNNINVDMLIKKNEEWIKDIINSYIELKLFVKELYVEDNIQNSFATLNNEWGIEYSEFNYSINPLYPSGDEFYIMAETLRRAVHDEEDELFLPHHIGFYISYDEGACTHNINIDHILNYNDHVDTVLYKRLEDFLYEYEKGIKKWIINFYENFDFHNIILQEVWARIEDKHIVITEDYIIDLWIP